MTTFVSQRKNPTAIKVVKRKRLKRSCVKKPK